MQDLISKLQVLLEENAAVKTKAWWENYMKGVIPFRGVKMAAIRKSLHTWYKELDVRSRSLQEQKTLADTLIQQNHAEDKLAGILFYQEILLKNGAVDWKKDLLIFADFFDQGHIYDWNICDWFCVRVLGPLIKSEGEECARAVSAWCTAENLWRSRASLIAFIYRAEKGEANFPGFLDMMF